MPVTTARPTSSFPNGISKSNLGISKAALETPDNFDATLNTGPYSVTLDWDDVATVGVVKIYRADNTMQFDLLATVDLGDETYEDLTVEAEHVYYYKIAAFDLPLGYSAFTDVETINIISGIQLEGAAYFKNDNAQPALDPGLESFVVEADVLLAIPADVNGFIISTGSEEGAGGVDLWCDGNSLIGEAYDASNHGIVCSADISALYNDGIVHRFAFAVDRNGNASLLIDGVEVDSTDAYPIATISIETDACYIGNITDASNQRLTGSLFGLNWMVGTSLPTDYSQAKLQPTAYSVGYWGFTELSGSIVDSQNAITLTKVGSPVYGVLEP